MLRTHDKIQTLTVFHHQAGCPHAWMQFWLVDTGSDLSFQHSAIKFFTKKRNPFQAAWMQHMQDIRVLPAANQKDDSAGCAGVLLQV